MGFERCSFGLIPWMGHSGPMNSAMPQRTRRKLSSTNGALVSLGGDLEIFLNTYIYIYIYPGSPTAVFIVRFIIQKKPLFLQCWLTSRLYIRDTSLQAQ